jgi:hypothetical protein
MVFTQKLLEEEFYLFPCSEENKPLLDIENYQKELRKFNNSMRLDEGMLEFTLKNNLAIPTGSMNRLIVVDVDVEYHGTKVWKTMLRRYNEGQDINTLRVQTPGGGFHYYFCYTDEMFLKWDSIYRPTFRGFGKAGIDLIIENGYVMSPYSLKNELLYLPINYFSNLGIRNQIKSIPNWLYYLFCNTEEARINLMQNRYSLK